jgi:hypothetical protein
MAASYHDRIADGNVMQSFSLREMSQCAFTARFLASHGLDNPRMRP